jgi:hypothetical protein
VPFAFTWKINTITLTFDRPKLTPEDETNLMACPSQQQSK